MAVTGLFQLLTGHIEAALQNRLDRAVFFLLGNVTRVLSTQRHRNKMDMLIVKHWVSTLTIMQPRLDRRRAHSDGMK